MFSRMVQATSNYGSRLAPAVGVGLLGLCCIFACLGPDYFRGYGQVVAGVAVAFQVVLVLRVTIQHQRAVTAIRESLVRLINLLRKSGSEQVSFTIPRGRAAREWGDKYRTLWDEIGRVHEELTLLKQQCATAEVRSRHYSLLVQRLNDLLDAFPDPVLIIDPSGRVVSCNRAAQSRLNIAAKSEVPANHSHDSALVDDLVEQVKKAVGANAVFDWQTAGPEGRSYHYRVVVREIGSSENGNRLECGKDRAVFLQDLTPLQELRKRHAEFVSAASHEMKAPLAAIRAYTEMLLDGEAGDEHTREEFISTIEAQAQRLQRLVENLLNTARIEAGILKVHKRPISVNEILQEAVRLMTAAANEKDIALLLEPSPLYLPINADRDLMLQAVINLISNAIKYTPNGGKVTVRSQLQDQTVVIEVEDTGVGMSPADVTRVFEKFYRVEAHKNMAPGTGLGLPLTKHIVEDVHGGTISVRSKVNEGSVFSIALPKASAAADRARTSQELATV
ncbi:MAG: ATP-binding protein [Thermogutta sp.]|nr:ATP-binding protein [Thermogutta sp.]HPU05373.1 ATP-binding protein [Thermogutta sp.]HQF14061.1 ATP-binding protein [Thermogutta sp.]